MCLCRLRLVVVCSLLWFHLAVGGPGLRVGVSVLMVGVHLRLLRSDPSQVSGIMGGVHPRLCRAVTRVSSSFPSSGIPSRSPASAYDAPVGSVDDLSVSTSRASLHGGPPGVSSAPARESSPKVSLAPIPVPSDRFTLAPIKSGNNYLQQRDVLLFWLRVDGFSTSRSDDLLITDSRNALASQFWEVQLRTSLRDGPARFLFENTGTTYFGKGFEML
jgi:hypothetical protein